MVARTMSSISTSYNITVERGKSLERFFHFQVASTGDPSPFPSGYAPRGQIRESDGRYGLTTETTLELDLSADDRLTIVEHDGIDCVRLFLSAADTILLSPDNEKKRKLVYAIEMFDESAPTINVSALVAGALVVLGEVAR